MKVKASNIDDVVSISSNEIHLWHVNDQEINDEKLLAYYHSILSDEERYQCSRLHFSKHRHQYLVAKALVRNVLSLYVKDIQPEEWVFGKNQYGRPYIKNISYGSVLNFNLSHTAEMVILAISLESNIGVDVEDVRRNVDILKLAENFFSLSEFNQLNDLPKAKQGDRFFDLWTLKEAYIKACGMGLSIPLNQFCYSFPESCRVDVSFDECRHDDPKYWRFWCVRSNYTHKIALAIKSIKPAEQYNLSMWNLVPFSKKLSHKFSVVRRSHIKT